MRSLTHSTGYSCGLLLTLVPFVLSWLLKEVPLRTTLAHRAEPPAGTVGEPAGGQLAASNL